MNQTAFKKLANNATLKGFNKGVQLYFKLKQAIVQYIYNINFSSNRLEFKIRFYERDQIFLFWNHFNMLLCTKRYYIIGMHIMNTIYKV